MKNAQTVMYVFRVRFLEHVAASEIVFLLIFIILLNF